AYLSAELTAVVQKFARQHQLTLNTLLQGAWSLLLSRYSGEKDVVYGTVISGRPPELAGSDSMVGLFINTLPVRVQMSSDEPLLPWLKSLQNQQLEVRQYEYSPLVQIHEWSGVSGRQPLFESIVVFENYPTDTSSSENEALQISEVQVTDRVTFPLSLWSRIPTGQEAEMSLLLRYNSHRFDSETIKLMLGHLQSLLAGFAANPDQTLADLSLLTEVERRRLLVDWNDTALDYPKDQGLHHLFEAQVKKTPTATAVTFEGKPYSYQVLNERANQLAHYLRSLGVGPEKLVGIYVERSFEMIVGLLGILKAGGAYVPMDPTFPEDRLAYMLANSETAVLLTQESLSDAGFIEQGEVDVVCLDKDWQFIAEQSVDNLTHEFKPHNLAYVIYTSGSTGKPKGVQIHHQAAVNFLYSMQKEPGLKADDVLLAITTISFDISVLEIYLPLINGAHVVLANREQSSDGQLLAKLIKDSKSTIVQATPATWKLLLAVGWEGGQGLKLLCGGEAMSRDLAKQLLPKVKELWNVYGPTETTVWSTVHRVTAVSNQISIGRPIANTQIYLLDERMQPVPTGVPGEMYIGGDGVSRGYLNRPELTAERFIPDPFSTDPNAILYKTGDAARYLPDGNIIFIGRLDFQVKIRGFRIELGEIEAVITTHDAISEVIVIVREDDPGDKRLVAYIISHDTNNPPEISAIQDFARKQLPAYMVPTAYVFLDSFPKTPNRKIDRKSLPAPDQSRPDIGDQYEPPQTDTQKSLEAIWCELLKTDKVGIQDNFFTLGGHSLLATRLLVRINDLMKVDISLRSFFEAPTIASLSEQIDTLHWLSQAPDSEFDTSEDREELEI
ncbi:MAG: amino acid adenylation domain-containing protein, partial [Anaerolineae bacterium]|nr:amino acid adenylation domain-containing protein [Anaerolineae bacterium]